MLYSEHYRDLQRQMHAERRYGDSGKKWANAVLSCAKKHRCDSILDYGAGTGAMIQRMQERREKGISIYGYDPGIEHYADEPKPRDLVACIDTLEHVEPNCLTAVLEHLHGLTQKVLFVVIALRAAGKHLPDGRNAHLIIQDAGWWRYRLEWAHFRVLSERLDRLPDEYVAELMPIR